MNDIYDAGLLNDFGGGNVEWWQDYIRAELGRSHDFYAASIETLRAELAASREREAKLAEALDTAAIRLAHLAGQIDASFGISGTLRADQAMKARHMSDEARAALAEYREARP